MGAVTVIVPVATLHVGCVKVTVGVAGVAGCALMITLNAAEVHPTALVVVTSYVPEVNPAKTRPAWVTGATTGDVPVTV